MRRTDREVTDIKTLLAILDQCKVCRVALQDNDGLYLIPLNFGYQYNGALTLYFHSAKEGRKASAFNRSCPVCFEVDCGHKLIEGATPCQYGYQFQSIVGNGVVRPVEGLDEKKMALSILMKHQTGKSFSFQDNMASSVAVYRLDVSSFTGKQNLI